MTYGLCKQMLAQPDNLTLAQLNAEIATAGGSELGSSLVLLRSAPSSSDPTLQGAVAREGIAIQCMAVHALPGS